MSGTAPTRAQIQHDVLEILKAKVAEADSGFNGQLTEQTLMVKDLEFESVNIVELCMAIGKHYRQKLPFQELVFRDKKFQDFSVADLVSFLEQRLPK